MNPDISLKNTHFGKVTQATFTYSETIRETSTDQCVKSAQSLNFWNNFYMAKLKVIVLVGLSTRFTFFSVTILPKSYARREEWKPLK